MTRTLLKCTLSLALIIIAHASDAVFSTDGQTITFLPYAHSSEQLWRMNLKTEGIDKIPLNLPKGETIRSLALGSDGGILVLTGMAVYINDAEGTKKLCQTTGVEDAKDLAMVPSNDTNDISGWIIITGVKKSETEPYTKRCIYGLKPGGKQFVPVFSRRIDQIGAGAFSSGGRYFFQADNALWEGSFHCYAGIGASLDAVSIASLAYCDSSVSNAGYYHVRGAVAVAGKRVYVALSGRHRDDRLLSVGMPSKAAPNNGTASSKFLESHYAMQSKVLSSVKVLDEDDYIGSLAATVVRGDERVFYVVHHKNVNQILLWTSRTRKVEVIGEYKVDLRGDEPTGADL